MPPTTTAALPPPSAYAALLLQTFHLILHVLVFLLSLLPLSLLLFTVSCLCTVLLRPSRTFTDDWACTLNVCAVFATLSLYVCTLDLLAESWGWSFGGSILGAWMRLRAERGPDEEDEAVLREGEAVLREDGEEAKGDGSAARTWVVAVVGSQ
ncbi:hypothetical protein BJ546DRAFT_1062436 [Cryomyces antarcticus]